jgi:hypothetical protein
LATLFSLLDPRRHVCAGLTDLVGRAISDSR